MTLIYIKILGMSRTQGATISMVSRDVGEYHTVLPVSLVAK